MFDEDTSQEEVFETIMPGLIESFLGGHHVNFMAYGQTGSGKTHTVFGPPHAMKEAQDNGGEMQP